MKRTSLAFLLVLGACGTKDAATKQDLALLQKEMQTKLVQDIAELRKEFGTLKEKFQQIEVISKKLEIDGGRIGKIADSVEKRADTAATDVVKSLEIQEQYLKQMLDSIRALIEELKKK